jgi:hypothetical protein
MSQVFVSGVDELPLFHVVVPKKQCQGAAGSARDRALEQVEQNADQAWKADALEAIRLTAERLPEFISDDVWETPIRHRTEHLAPAREDRALGPVMLAAARRGWIRKTDRVRPSVRSHLSGKPVWTSLIRKAGTEEG